MRPGREILKNGEYGEIRKIGGQQTKMHKTGITHRSHQKKSKSEKQRIENKTAQVKANANKTKQNDKRRDHCDLDVILWMRASKERDILK